MAEPRLRRYRQKRRFDRSGEPRGTRTGRGQRNRFVIQKHDASSLHYDFRLEVGGVLWSWAVPKGLSTDTRHKRLAIQTEDHPLDYAGFEGVIPSGEYGGGTVMVWDGGTYRNLRAAKQRNRRDMKASFDEGLIEIELSGAKLTGGYALKRIRSGRKPQWLIIKMNDRKADARRRPQRTQPNSVKTGRTLREIASDEQTQ